MSKSRYGRVAMSVATDLIRKIDEVNELRRETEQILKTVLGIFTHMRSRPRLYRVSIISRYQNEFSRWEVAEHEDGGVVLAFHSDNTEDGRRVRTSHAFSFGFRNPKESPRA